MNGELFAPDKSASLDALGIKHKSVIRMHTPGLDGIGGSGS